MDLRGNVAVFFCCCCLCSISKKSKKFVNFFLGGNGLTQVDLQSCWRKPFKKEGASVNTLVRLPTHQFSRDPDGKLFFRDRLFLGTNVVTSFIKMFETETVRPDHRQLKTRLLSKIFFLVPLCLYKDHLEMHNCKDGGSGG